MRVVLDTNILVMTLTSRSPYHFVYKYLVQERYDLVLNHEILLEYEEIITLKYGEATSSFFLQLLHELPNVHFVNTYYHWNLIEQDNDDNKYTDTAVAGQAAYLVSEDRHFLILQSIAFPPIKLLNLSQFAEILSRGYE